MARDKQSWRADDTIDGAPRDEEVWSFCDISWQKPIKGL